MTPRALALVLLLALVGCADGSGGARLVWRERTAYGVIEHYRMSDGEIRRLWRPDFRPEGVRWMYPGEQWPR